MASSVFAIIIVISRLRGFQDTFAIFFLEKILLSLNFQKRLGHKENITKFKTSWLKSRIHVRMLIYRPLSSNQFVVLFVIHFILPIDDQSFLVSAFHGLFCYFLPQKIIIESIHFKLKVIVNKKSGFIYLDLVPLKLYPRRSQYIKTTRIDGNVVL